MRTIAAIILMSLALSASLAVPRRTGQIPADAAAFWSIFQTAVKNDDRQAVASLTRFPLGMPYGVRSIRTKAQLMRNYRKIFDAPTKQCFSEAQPTFEAGHSNRFYIGCGEAMMYWFEKVKGQYKFASVDNINE